MPKSPKGMFRRGKAYCWRRKKRGKESWRSLGTDYAEACRQCRKLNRELDYGETLPVRMTVAEASDKWLLTCVRTRRASEKDQRLARRRVEMYLKPFFGYTLLRKVTKDTLLRYRIFLEGKSISAQTVRHILSDARCLFRWCEDNGYISRAPVPHRLLPRIQEKPPDKLSDDEVALVSSLPYPWGFTARFGLATGLRWGEMARAQVSDIKGGWLVVSQTKSRRVRRVRLLYGFEAELRGRVGKIIPYSQRSSGSFNRDVRRKTGIQSFHAHRLRHTFACRWADCGGNLAALQQLLGHTSIVTTQRYARMTDSVVEQEARKVEGVAESVAVQFREQVSVSAL